MIQISMIGNLAADAEVKNTNGKEWLTFRLADTRRWKDQKEAQHESTQWASCIMSNTQGKLAQYLKKGVRVYVQGSSEIELYSSPKLRQMVARYNISVQHIELCGGQVDDVPRRLVTPDGLLLDVFKAYYIDPNVQAKEHFTSLTAERGGLFSVDPNGFVLPIQPEAKEGEQAQVPVADEPIK